MNLRTRLWPSRCARPHAPYTVSGLSSPRAMQLRIELARHSVRVIDLFREWDDDDNGLISRDEFHKAMRELKFDATPDDIDKVFDEWDPDGSGALELKELILLLRRNSPAKDGKSHAARTGQNQSDSYKRRRELDMV